jgi:molybdopterin synthase catalytic subunit
MCVLKASEVEVKTGVYPKTAMNLADVLHTLFSLGFDKNIGAVTTFLGVARAAGKENKVVTKLEMQSYEKHANRVLEQICDEVRSKHKLNFVKILHLLGEFDVGEPVVLVVVGSARRKEAFQGLSEAVERYKKEPALFKKEVYADGSHAWIE